MLKKIGIGFIGILGFLSLMEGIYLKTQKKEAMSIGIIGGADGPTSIFLAGKLNPIGSLANIFLIVGADFLFFL